MLAFVHVEIYIWEEEKKNYTKEARSVSYWIFKHLDHLEHGSFLCGTLDNLTYTHPSPLIHVMHR
jgi:hypothetical protein